MNSYKSYRNLPPLAGTCLMEEAMKPGLSVEECVRRLKRYHHAFKRLHQIFTARITAEPIYELKMGFSLHAHLCAEHVTALRRRIGARPGGCVGAARSGSAGMGCVTAPSVETVMVVPWWPI